MSEDDTGDDRMTQGMSEDDTGDARITRDDIRDVRG